MVALRSQGNWRWEGPLGTPLGFVHWKRASSAVEAGTSVVSSPPLLLRKSLPLPRLFNGAFVKQNWKVCEVSVE